jgi:multiple sugar transport system permease protein
MEANPMSAVETAPRRRRRRRRWSQSREARWGVGLTSIWLVGFLVFSAVPLAMSVYISFTSWAPISGPFWDAHTVGLKNYATFLHDHVFWHSVGNTIYYAVGSVGVVNLVALPMALLLNQKLRGLNIFRTIFYLPAILPTVAIVLVFRLILFPGTGLVSWILTKVGVQCDTTQVTCNPIDWLNNPHLTMPAVILVSAWGVGQTLLIYLAGLQGIDRSLYEAGAVDGTTGWSAFRYITLPLLTPAIFFNVVTGLIGAFQEFTKLVIFAGGATATGGPEHSLLTTFWYVYIEGFDYSHMGLATAMAFGLFVLILIFTGLNFLGQKRWVFYQEERR